MRASILALGFALVLPLVLLACTHPPPAPSCKQALARGQLVITEVFAEAKNPPGAFRWFELYNPTDAPVVLDGAQLVHGLVSKSDFYGHYVTALSIPAGGYVAVGDAPPDQLPSYLAYGYGSDLGALDDDYAGGTLTVSCGATDIATVTYTAPQTGHAYAMSAGITPSPTLEADTSSWCEATDHTFAMDNYGTPGAPNDCVPAGNCFDGTTSRAIVAPTVGELVISEVMTEPTQVPRTTGEWVEATALADFDLNGLALARADPSIKPAVITATDCMTVGSGDFVVFAKTSDPTMNGGLPPASIAWTFSFALIEGSAGDPGDVGIVAGSNVIDAVTWTGSISGASWQLDPSMIGAMASVNPTSWCASTTPFGLGDLGTPGAANLPCSTPGP